jgi:predicted ATPase
MIIELPGEHAMKISISGLGIIPDSQICLRPLTIFVGENGTGKTWTAYTIAGIFSSYALKQAYLRGESALHTPIRRIISDLIKKGTATLNIVDFSKKYTEIYINEIAKSAPNWLNEFLATKRADFSKMKIKVEITDASKQAFSNSLMGEKIKAEAFVGYKEKVAGESEFELKLKCLKEKGSNRMYFYTTSSKHRPRRIPLPVVEEEIRRLVMAMIFQTLAKLLYNSVAFFPTERTTFITFPFIHDKERYYKKAKLEAENESESADIKLRLSQPVTSFVSIMDSCTTQYSAGEERKAQDPEIKKLIRLGNFLENKILLGNISTETHGNRIELMHTPSEKVNLELSVSSSMVKELTPLALYLRCLAKPGDLVVIDEPEMNLHPAAQVQLAEFLGMLVNAGLHVLITTHSPYIVDHIPNLIRANDLDKKKVKKHFYLRQVTSFLPKDKVSIYLFDYNAVTDILQENGDINWKTFSEVSRDLSRIYSNLIQ